MDIPAPISHRNNFNLIRLAAAAQVAILHGAEHVGLRLPFHETTLAILDCFPGVPIFFFISGFLIASSYERETLAGFAWNRGLRIFPALWACFLVSVASVWGSGYFADHPVPLGTAAAWFAAQMSMGQFFNPGFMRDYGVGALNGSLWTIPVELQFYILAPVVVLLFRRVPLLFWTALGVFAAINFAHTQYPIASLRKVFAVTFAPWIYMFMLGAVAHFFWPKIRSIFVGKLLLWGALYAAVVALDVTVGIGASSNNILLPFVLALSGLVLAAANTAPGLSSRILGKNDISYGLYIYHMPVYNFLLYKHLSWGWLGFGVAVLCAALSWWLVERRALRLKDRRKPLTRPTWQEASLREA